MSKLEEIFEEVSESIAAKRVYGEPYEKNGVTIIPAATVMGGAGGGEGTAGETQTGEGASVKPAGPGGFGGGFGISGRPAGAWVIKGDDVKWLPAVDVNRMLLGFQIVMVVFFLVMRSMAKARAKARVEIARQQR